MPWVQEELRHDSFLDDFWNVVLRRFTDDEGNHWWANYSDDLERIDAFKISFEAGLLVANCDGDFIPNHSYPEPEIGGYLAISRHMIIRRYDGELLGLAQSTGAVKINPLLYSKDPATFLNEMRDLFYETVDYTKLYAYMLDKYEHHTHYESAEGEKLPITFISEAQFNGVLASSLDIEFHSEEYYGKDMLQSPIMAIDLIHGTTYSVGAIGKLNYKTETNWWNDSKIKLEGNIDTNSFCFVLRADNAPIWHDGKVPQTPFFFGDVYNKEYDEYIPVAMFGGKAVDKNYDFDNTEIITNEAMMPTTRNYVHYPSNGVDSVMLKRTKYGARYQAHYLSWEVPPNEIPPDRKVYEVNPDAIAFAKERKIFEDKLGEAITPETTTFKFKAGGMAEPTSVLTTSDVTHILIGDSEIVELVDYDVDNWTMTVKRIVEKPLSHSNDDMLYGITANEAGMFYRKQPRSWNNMVNNPDYYKYTPHPSRYSEKLHTSRLYLVHPEEGVVGELPNLVVSTSINIFDGTRLTFTKPCAEEDCEEYVEPPLITSPGALKWNPAPNSLVGHDGDI